MAASSSCDVSGHHELFKKIMYSPKKCSICKKRCLFGLKKMVKCIACKNVMHKKCLASRSAAQMACGVEVEPRSVCTATTATVLTNQCVRPFDKDVPARADNDEVLLEETATAVGQSAVVPVQVLPISTTRLSWLKQDEILRASTAALREVQYDQQALQAVPDVPAKKTALNGPESGSAVALRPVWTGSVMVSDRFSWLCTTLTYDPAVGPDMRIVLHWAVLSTSAATSGPSWLLPELVLLASAATGSSWLLPELIILASAATRPSGCLVQHDLLLKEMLQGSGGGDVVKDYSRFSWSADRSECRYKLCVARTFHSAFSQGARVLLRRVVFVDLLQTLRRRIHAKNAVTQNALPVAPCVTAFEYIKMVLKDKQNAERKQHRANVNVPSVFHIVVSRKLEFDLFKSKLTKSDYLRLCEPWTFKKVKKNEAERNVYSLTITNSKFKNFNI